MGVKKVISKREDKETCRDPPGDIRDFWISVEMVKGIPYNKLLNSEETCP